MTRKFIVINNIKRTIIFYVRYISRVPYGTVKCSNMNCISLFPLVRFGLCPGGEILDFFFIWRNIYIERTVLAAAVRLLVPS